MQTPETDSHYVKMQSDDAKAVPAPVPTRPQLPGRSASERVRPTAPAPLRGTASVRALVRLLSVQEEPSQAAAAGGADATRPRQPSSGGSLTDRSTRQVQSIRRGLGAPSVAPLVRAVSSMIRLRATSEPRAEETFRCHICFDDVGVSEAVTLTTCGHKYCLSCFKPYLEVKISEGNIYPMCFHPPYLVLAPPNGDANANSACGVAVSPDQIKQIVDPDVYAKYEHFRFNKEHQHARDCPFCSHSQECAGPHDPTCVCEQCGKTFCFFHGNAHVDSTCADYELKTAQEESINRAKIDEISKPCPGCRSDVEKNGGCNHMKCINCNTSFCWICGEIIEDTPTPSHYASGSCGGKQFDGMEETPPTCMQASVVALLSLLTVPPSFLLALVLTPLLWPCNRSKTISELFSETMGFIVVVLVSILIFVITSIYEVLEGCFWLVVLLVFGVVELVKFLFSCCRSKKTPSEAMAADIQDVDELEAGVAQADGPKTEESASIRAGAA